MKLKRLKKNAVYSFAYGCSKKRFKKNVMSSTCKGLSRIPARKLKQVMNETIRILGLPLGDNKHKEIMRFINNR